MEDLITAVTHSFTMAKNIDVEDMEFLHSVGYQIGDGKQLSTRQCYAIRFKLRQYIGHAADLGVTVSEEEFRQTIEANVWRSAPKITVEKRSEARYLGDNLLALSYTAKKDMHRTLTSMGAKHREGLTILSVYLQRLQP